MVTAHQEVDPTPLEEYNDLPSENDPKGNRCYFFSVSIPPGPPWQLLPWTWLPVRMQARLDI